MKIIETKEELVQFFAENQEPLGALITTRTVLKLNKKSRDDKTILNPHDVVYKFQTIKANVNEDYAEVVNIVREFEDKPVDFVAQERKWGKHVSKAVIEKDEGQLYLNVIEIEKVGDTIYKLPDGTIVEKSELTQFMPPYKASTGGSQETDIAIKYRTYKMESVVGVLIEDTLTYLVE